jgi:hypothetical protein
MTVAHVRERRGAESVDVMFLESARVFRLPRAHPSFDRVLGQLRDAVAHRHVLSVTLAAPDGELIEDVHGP